MILMYHKVDLAALSSMWVTVDAFRRQMLALQPFDVVTLDEYDPTNPRHAAITFDDVYDGVVKYAVPVMHQLGYPFELFINSDWIGRENDFDRVKEPSARFATLAQLDQAVRMGGRIQWHTRSHRRLREAGAEVLAYELEAPAELRKHYGKGHLDWLAYPWGDFDDDAAAAARSRFRGAVATAAGDNADRHRLTRVLMREDSVLPGPSVSAVVMNADHGHALAAALDSLLRQSYPADEILVIDDASGIPAREVVACFAKDIRAEYNLAPLGKAGCFRQALRLAKSDYVLFVSADHRLRSDTLEQCTRMLDRSPGINAVSADIASDSGPVGIAAGSQAGSLLSSVPRGQQPLQTGEAAMYRRASYLQDKDSSAVTVHIAAPLFEIQPCTSTSRVASLEIENSRLRAMLRLRDRQVNFLQKQLLPSVQRRRFTGSLMKPPRRLMHQIAGLSLRVVRAVQRRLLPAFAL
jgi:peptidoglycan/xylan/chitin deacetylase (PgdA/CDA1 family)